MSIRKQRHHALAPFALAALLCLSACQSEPPVMTPQEVQRVNDLTAHMQTKCLGRQLIEVPASFVLNSESSSRINGVSLKLTPMTKAGFEQRLYSRTQLLEAAMHPGKDKTRKVLRETIRLSGRPGVVFERSSQFFSSARLGRTLELMSWLDGVFIEGTIDATDPTFPENANDAPIRSLKLDIKEKLSVLLDTVARVTARQDSEIPTEPGLCIANGFVRGPMGPEDSTQMAYHLKGEQDSYYSFVTDAGLREEKSLLQRSGQIERDLARVGGKVLRKAERQPAGQRWEEMLASSKVSAGFNGVYFIAAANETSSGPERPFTELRFSTGEPIPRPTDMSDEEMDRLGFFKSLERPGLSQAEAIALWDKVIATIRPRPGA